MTTAEIPPTSEKCVRLKTAKTRIYDWSKVLGVKIKPAKNKENVEINKTATASFKVLHLQKGLVFAVMEILSFDFLYLIDLPKVVLNLASTLIELL